MEDVSASNDNHSDSDISESWTLVDTTVPNIELRSSIIDSATDVNDHNSKLNDNGQDEEEDTDGVAVISDDEDVSTFRESPVSSTTTKTTTAYFCHPRDTVSGSTRRGFDPETSSTTTIRDSEEELLDDYYFTGKKIKLYVHKRNNKVSNLLNIILLGTVVTAATLAVGFMWGINDTCSLDMLDSVNKILTNLQKLQHENEILKSKIKMMQVMQHSKPISGDLRGDHFEQFLHHQMFENNIFDSSPKINRGFPIGENLHHDNKPELNGQNIEADKLNAKWENVFHETRDDRKHIKKDAESGALVMGPKTYCEYLEDTTDCNFKNNCQSSYPINSPCVTDKSSNKDAKKKEKITKKQKDKKRKALPVVAQSSEKYDPLQNENIDNLNTLRNADWYYKMSDARRMFRDKGFDEYDLKNQNKAKWYFKRMNEREKYRHYQTNLPPSDGTRNREYLKNKW